MHASSTLARRLSGLPLVILIRRLVLPHGIAKEVGAHNAPWLADPGRGAVRVIGFSMGISAERLAEMYSESRGAVVVFCSGSNFAYAPNQLFKRACMFRTL